MLSAIHSAVQSIQRSQKGLQVAANNIANLNTNGYKSQRYNGRADAVEVPNERPAFEDDPRGEDIPVNDVDLAGEIVDQIMHKTAFKANVTSIKVAEETTGTLLDILVD